MAKKTAIHIANKNSDVLYGTSDTQFQLSFLVYIFQNIGQLYNFSIKFLSSVIRMAVEKLYLNFHRKLEICYFLTFNF